MTLKEKCVKLLIKWQHEINYYETNYQFGRCGADDMSMDHGRYEQLQDCAAYLQVVLESEEQ